MREYFSVWLVLARVFLATLLVGIIVFCLASLSMYYEIVCIPVKPTSESKGFGIRLSAGVAKFATSPEFIPQQSLLLKRAKPFEMQSFKAIIYEITILAEPELLVVEIPMIGLSITLIFFGGGGVWFIRKRSLVKPWGAVFAR